MIKRFILVAALAFVAAVPAWAETSPAPAAAAPAAAANADHFPPAVLAVVDIERIMKESTAGKSVSEQLTSRRTTYQQQVAADEQKLREAEQALVQQRATLTPEQLDTKRQEFQTKARAAQQRVQERARALETAFDGAIRTIKQNVAQIVAELAKAHGVSVVVDKSQVIVVESSLDLTNAVIDQLNKKLPRVDVKVADAPAARGQQSRNR